MALATAIKVGGSLLGGLLGRKKTSNRVDYARLRRDAEAAGFNPLTALIHGGAAGYTQTSAPPLQTAGLIMDAANALSDHYKTPDPVAQERERLEQELLKARIDALQGSARSTGVMGSTMAAQVGSVTGSRYGVGYSFGEPVDTPTEPQRPVEVAGDGSVAASVEGMQDVVQPDGTVVRVPVGPDIDEVISGAVISTVPAVSRFWRDDIRGRAISSVAKNFGPALSHLWGNTIGMPLTRQRTRGWIQHQNQRLSPRS